MRLELKDTHASAHDIVADLGLADSFVTGAPLACVELSVEFGAVVVADLGVVDSNGACAVVGNVLPLG